MGMMADFWTVKWTDEDTKIVHRIAEVNRNEEIFDEAMRFGSGYEDNVYLSLQEAAELSNRLAQLAEDPELPGWKAKQALDAALALDRASQDESISEILYEASA